MRRLPPLNALKTFEAVARLSSITRAGEELCVSHSSVSQQVKVLENYFGQKLFLRRGRSIEPTNAALAYLEEVRTCLDRIAISSEALTRYGKQQTISLNATPSFAMRWLIPKTASFQMMYPSIKLEISTSASDHIDDLRESYDFVFRRDWMDQRGLECHRILDDFQTPVMSPTLHEANQIEAPKDLANLTILHMRSRPDAWAHWFSMHGLEEELPSTDGPIYDHFFLSLQAAIAGHGIAIGSRVLIEEDIENGRLMTPYPLSNIEGPGFHVLFRPELHNDQAGRKFIKWLEQASETELTPK